jgi:hypothetical protein
MLSTWLKSLLHYSARGVTATLFRWYLIPCGQVQLVHAARTCYDGFYWCVKEKSRAHRRNH